MSRIILIGCGKDKAAAPAPAELLYIGGLFRARRHYAQQSGDRWFIVSAKHGLLRPSTAIRPYSKTIDELSPLDLAAWKLQTVSMLLDELADNECLSDLTVELHMGNEYARPLLHVIELCGMSCELPLSGLGIGEQLAWYAEQRRTVGTPGGVG